MKAELTFKRGLILNGLGILFICYEANLVDQIQYSVKTSDFEKHYVDPKTLHFNQNPQSSKRLNLVLLYVESLEHIFADESIHGENLIKDIESIPGQLMPYFESVPGTGWTMAGMLSSQCAIPLKAFLRNLSTKEYTFLKNGTCITDVLHNAGYEHFLFVPHEEEFASMDQFYKQHGKHKVYGVKDWKKKYTEDDLNSWGGGVTDDILLKESLSKLKELHKGTKPFVMTIATTDTHSTDGYISKACKITNPKLSSFQNAYKCTAFFVKQFIEQLKAEGILENTIVVIMGDHPFMHIKAQIDYFQKPRNVYFKVISPVGIQFNREKMTHYDIAPTLLHMLNILPTTQNRFGLGMSLIGDYKHTDYEILFKAALNPYMLNSSNAYNKLWY